MKKAVYCTSNFTAFVNIEGVKKKKGKKKKKKKGEKKKKKRRNIITDSPCPGWRGYIVSGWMKAGCLCLTLFALCAVQNVAS